jgi:hypothetical protein
LRGKIIVLVAMLALLIYGSSIVYIQAQYPGYGEKYRPLIGGIQIEITKAEWYGPSYSKGFCSLAFPVSFTENNNGRLGFITAGHCIETANGGDYVDQPRKGPWWDWGNFIGRGIRSSWPYGGGSSDLDAALIRLENTGYEAFIYENGNHYFGSDREDRNYRVGITGYLTPTSNMIGTIVYKSGRTTGLTYGQILQIDYRWTPRSTNVAIYPTILISRCPNNQCYYNDSLSDVGDSGGVWYIRYVIYSERIDGFRVYDYGAKIIGIHNGRPHDDDLHIRAVASWAVKVSEKWSDLKISYATCGSEYSSSCR